MADCRNKDVCFPFGSANVNESDLCKKIGSSQSAPLHERFAQHAAEHLREDGCLIVVFQPWSVAAGPPAGILAPNTGGELALLGDSDVSNSMEGKSTVIVPCTFQEKAEEVAAHRILSQLSGFRDVCVIIVHLIVSKPTPTLAEVEDIMTRHDAMLAIGVDDVIFNPSLSPKSLRSTVAMAREGWMLNTQRIRVVLESSPEPPSHEEMDKLEVQLRKLLWRGIPSALMPHFPRLDQNLVESDDGVGNYRFQGKFRTVMGVVKHAVDTHTNAQYAIKIIEKDTVFAATELEGIYREFRFLTDVLKHPNIPCCKEMLQSSARIYLVFEFAGHANLAHVLSSQPGLRLQTEKALDCFRQLVAGLEHCHKRETAHRSISLEHIVVAPRPADHYHCCLVDFHSAMVARDGAQSTMVCGTLPCMAPEMLMQSSYVPLLADCWSAGVVLLEMGGGMSSLSRSVPFDVKQNNQHTANKINSFFENKGSHETALAFMGGVRVSAILRHLELLIVPVPSNRSDMSTCLFMLTSRE